MPIAYSTPASDVSFAGLNPRAESEESDNSTEIHTEKQQGLDSPPWKCAPSPILNFGHSPWSNTAFGGDQTLDGQSNTPAGQSIFFTDLFKNREGFQPEKSPSGQSTPTWPPTTAPMSPVTPTGGLLNVAKDPPAPAFDDKVEPGVPQDGATVAKHMLAEKLTTVMLRNVHNRVCAEEFALKLDALGFENQYDLCLIPTDPNSGRGKGYGFVNFLTPHVASYFCEIAETISFERTNGKRLQVAVARLQGVELTLQNRTRKAKKKSRAGSIVFTANNNATTSPVCV
jgi:hypothetical protein